VVQGIKRRAKSPARMHWDGGIPTQDMEIPSIGANTHQGCTDFDRDAEIWDVWFRERPGDYARSGGQAGGSPKSSPGCTDFSLDAANLGLRVPRATGRFRQALRWLLQGAAGRFRFSGAPWRACRTLWARSFSETILKASGPGCTDFSRDAGILGCRVPRATAGGSGAVTWLPQGRRPDSLLRMQATRPTYRSLPKLPARLACRKPLCDDHAKQEQPDKHQAVLPKAIAFQIGRLALTRLMQLSRHVMPFGCSNGIAAASSAAPVAAPSGLAADRPARWQPHVHYLLACHHRVNRY
jgi:hypothetical protein